MSLLFGVNKEPRALTLNTTIIAILLDNCRFLQCQYIAQLWHSYWRDSIGITLGFCRQYFLDWWWSGSLYGRLNSQSNWKVRLNLLRYLIFMKAISCWVIISKQIYRKNTLLVIISLNVIAAIFYGTCGLAKSVEMLLIARFIVGIGAGESSYYCYITFKNDFLIISFNLGLSTSFMPLYMSELSTPATQNVLGNLNWILSSPITSRDISSCV